MDTALKDVVLVMNVVRLILASVQLVVGHFAPVTVQQGVVRV